LINADKGLISKIQRATGCNFVTANEIVEGMSTENAIPIPDGATNGDMIKVMFPNFHTDDLSYTIWVGYDQMSFKRDWWNAPYNPPKQNLAPADKSGLGYADQPTLQSAT
jgi:hypothetical protein